MSARLADDRTGRGRPDSTPLLDQRSLNRALLARQMLLDRQRQSAHDALHRLAGIQSQAPLSPYVALWTRLADFRHDELARLIQDRLAVRIALMRGTIHLVTADDCLHFRPLVQPVLDRWLQTSYGRYSAGLDIDRLAAAGRAALEERPRTFHDLGKLLVAEWPDRDANALAQIIRGLVPLVQVPPRGIWGARGAALHTTAEAWLGRLPASDPSPDDLVLRYLAAFGPATVQDVQTWSGLTRLGEVTDRLRPRLYTFRDPDGKELFDLPDAPRPDPETPAPPRFLAEFDSALLSHADRTRIISDEHRGLIFTVNGIVRGAVLVDGYVHGTWKVAKERGGATLRVELFQPASASDQSALADEGARLLAFTDAGKAHDIQFISPE